MCSAVGRIGNDDGASFKMSASPSSQSVRIDPDDHQRLKEMARAMGEPMAKVVHRALKALHDELILEATNTAYAALKKNGKAWAEEVAERKALDGSLADGLGD